MKFYDDDKNLVMVQTVASANTYVSSITGIIKKYILKGFPKNYFKKVYIDTSETFLENNKNELYNKSLNKIPYPSLSVSPQLSLDDPVFGLRSFYSSDPNFVLLKPLNENYVPLLHDPDNRYSLYYSVDSNTINVKFRIVVNSFDEATMVSYYLKSKINDLPKYMDNQLVQTEVPKSLVNTIAKIENLFTEGDQITNEEDLHNLDLLLTSLGLSQKRIIRKQSLNTGKQCYFFDQQENLLTMATDLDIPDSMIRDGGTGNAEYEINFRVQVTGWMVNAFIMTINTNKINDAEHLIDTNASDSLSNNGFTSISIGSPLALDKKDIIRFYDKNADGSDGEINTGQNIIHRVFSFNKSTNLQRINLSYLINEQILKVHAYAKEKGYNLTKLFYIVARSFTANDLSIGKIDYENLYIDFENPIDTDVVIDVFLNRLAYESILAAMNDDVFFKNDHAMAVLHTVYTDENGEKQIGKIRIYKFNSPEEYFDTTVEKSFRINTSYGIGYIGLVREGNINASDFKICLGKDKYGNNIIRCMEKA